MADDPNRPSDDQPNQDTPALYPDDDWSAHIGSLRIPFPFSMLMSCLFLPVLVIGAAISIPVTRVRNYLVARRERRFAEAMKSVGRWLSYPEMRLQAEESGCVIDDFLSSKGPVRLWWTPENIADESPYPCCHEDWPWEHEDGGFFAWAAERYTDPLAGTAKLFDLPSDEAARNEHSEFCANLRSQRRYVSVVHQKVTQPDSSA